MLTIDGVAQAWNRLDKVTSHFLSRKVCSTNKFQARDIVRVPILDVHFWYYELLRVTNVMTLTNKPEWREIWIIWSFLQAYKPVLKHLFERKTSSTFSLFLSEHAHIVWLSWGSSNLHSSFGLALFAFRVWRTPFPSRENKVRVSVLFFAFQCITCIPSSLLSNA